MLGRANIVGIRRTFQLVQDRVVDGWLAGPPDLRGAEHPELTARVLSRMPAFFTCTRGHTLVDRPSITLQVIAGYPTLALASGSYPLVEEALKRLGSWNNELRMGRYRRERWEGLSEAGLVIGYGTPLSRHVSGGQLRRLPFNLPLASGDALVIGRDWHAHARLQELMQHTRECLQRMAKDGPEIEMVEG